MVGLHTINCQQYCLTVGKLGVHQDLLIRSLTVIPQKMVAQFLPALYDNIILLDKAESGVSNKPRASSWIQTLSELAKTWVFLRSYVRTCKYYSKDRTSTTLTFEIRYLNVNISLCMSPSISHIKITHKVCMTSLCMLIKTYLKLHHYTINKI